MVNAVDTTDAELDGVSIMVMKSTKKDQKNYLSLLLRNDKALPVFFTGVSTEEVRSKAMEFYNVKLKGNEDEYSFVTVEGDDNEAQEIMLNAFSNRPAAPAGGFKEKGPDLRRVKGKFWVYNLELKHRVKLFPDEMAPYFEKGYKEGRGPQWDESGALLPVKGPRVCKTDQEDYTHPFKDTKFINNGVERRRIPKSEWESWKAKGYGEGRGVLVDPSVEIEETPEPGPREFTTPDAEWDQSGTSVGEIDSPAEAHA